MRVRIIGAGIAGLCAAWAYQRQGFQVAVYDCGPIPNPFGGSYDQHRLHHPFPAADAAAASRFTASNDAWALVWQDLGHRYFSDCGVITIPDWRTSSPTAALDILKRAGLRGEVMSGRRLRDALPVLELPAGLTGIRCADAGFLLADRILDRLCDLIRERGGSLFPFEGLAMGRDGSFAMPGREEGWDLTILACGAWNHAVLSLLGISEAQDYRPVAQTVLYLDPCPVQLPAWQRMPAFIHLGNDDELWGVPPLAGTQLKVAIGALAREVAEVIPNDQPSPAIIHAIEKAFSVRFRSWQNYRIAGASQRHYARGPEMDWSIKSLDPAILGGWVFGGCNGSGFKSAPAAALRLVASTV